jgi:predicted HicB family RNase H-like nuclease
MDKSKPRFAEIIRKARESETAEPQREIEESVALPDSQSAPLQGAPGKVVEEMVHLSIRVPKRLRMHWVAEAKRSDTSLTAVITEALNTKFGTPDKR